MFGIVTSNKNKYGDVTSTFNEMPSLKAKASRIRAMLPIREAMKELIAAGKVLDLKPDGRVVIVNPKKK